MWAIQYALSFWQMRRYYRRLAELRREGVVSVGMAGSAWKRRQYAVLVVDQNNRIVHVEQLSGWTVLATLKPVPGLAGRPVSDLLDDSIQLPVSKKLLAALRHAVQFMQEHAERMAAKAKAQGDTEDSALVNCSA
jgi:DNA-binding transcriptional regulator of glucitol operon